MPHIQSLGGIGSNWWAGFAIAAAVMPNHPNSSAVLNHYARNYLFPVVENSAVKQTYWRELDTYIVFEDSNALVFQGSADSIDGAELPTTSRSSMELNSGNVVS